MNMTEKAAVGDTLTIKNLNAFYGESHVLHGVDMEVRPGEVVGLLGRNGVGKSTTLRAITGILPNRRGSIRFGGRELIGMPRYKIARLGIGYVPEERGIFSNLDVEENLNLPLVVRPGGWTPERIYRMFPNLQGRGNTLGTRLSGGEQQMLAIARVLRTGSRMLLLDEASEGLAPVIVQQIANAIRALKDDGFTILLVEQNFRFASSIADRFYVMEDGMVIDMIEKADFASSKERILGYLGV